MKYVARTPLAGMVRSGCQGKRRVRRDTVPAILNENSGVPKCAWGDAPSCFLGRKSVCSTLLDDRRRIEFTSEWQYDTGSKRRNAHQSKRGIKVYHGCFPGTHRHGPDLVSAHSE
jgi:hypothetical protein